MQREAVGAVRTYVLVCAGLIALTVLSVGLALVDLHGWNSVVALGIATVQAVLGGVFFMHLRWSPPMTRLVGLAALLWLGILIVGVMDDVLTRGWLPVPGK
jgi:cytochrome c oxidase subunit IV